MGGWCVWGGGGDPTRPDPTRRAQAAEELAAEGIRSAEAKGDATTRELQEAARNQMQVGPG